MMSAAREEGSVSLYGSAAAVSAVKAAAVCRVGPVGSAATRYSESTTFSERN